jgi:hypothetical protein
MVNLSNLTHNYVWVNSNEQYTSIVASLVETDTDVSIDVEGLLYGRSNCKTSYNKISK